jgi:2-polyprenyl-3-methyl-5-hydroxy-6-metoxy-1,4-benzoquinol methylase
MGTQQTVRNYDDYWSSLTSSHACHPGNRFRYELIVAELKRLDVVPKLVMDCGCGDGSLLGLVSRAMVCGELHGMDVAASVLANRPGSGIRFRQHDLGTPVAADLAGRFDLVLCSEVIEHVPDDRGVIENLARLASPGGWVVVTTQSGRIYGTEQYLGHLRHYRMPDLQRRIERAGLQTVRAYLCGWPWLNAQKIAAHHFQGTVQKQIVRAESLSLPVRALFSFLQVLYRCSSRQHGPQIVLIARKAVQFNSV